MTLFKNLITFCFLSCLISSCSSGTSSDKEILKHEIVSIERNFAQMAAEKGLKEAFLSFAAEEAVIKRNGKIIKGRENIGIFYADQNDLHAKLVWEPEYVEVAKSGDLAYTYGPFTFTSQDSLGNTIESKGYFHTVWKRQPGGAWKFVYD